MYAELERTKKCAVCKLDKSQGLFFKDKRRSQGLARECKECKKKEVARSRIENPGRWKAKRHRNMIKEKFGIEIDVYNKLFESQNGSCDICKTHQSLLNKRLFVDHCHRTNMVRGLLCQKCNFMLGQASDSESIFKAAISYLRKFKK